VFLSYNKMNKRVTWNDVDRERRDKGACLRFIRSLEYAFLGFDSSFVCLSKVHTQCKMLVKKLEGYFIYEEDILHLEVEV
jgi:hypothetical protein